MLNKLKRKKENNNKMNNKNIYNNVPKHLKHLSVEKLRGLFYIFKGKI